MRGARGSSVAAAGPPRPLRRVFSRRTESGAREAKSVRGNTAAADGPGARLAAPVASRSPAVVLRCLQLPSRSQRVAPGACVPGSLLPALGSPGDARPLHPRLQHPARRKALSSLSVPGPGRCGFVAGGPFCPWEHGVPPQPQRGQWTIGGKSSRWGPQTAPSKRQHLFFLPPESGP